MSDPNQMLQLTSELSDELLLEICEAADVIACECPGYLAQLLSQVRAFRSYTTSCIDQFPEDAETHRWLIQQAQQVEKLLLETIAELMRREDLLDEANYILLDKMSERARATALKQIGR